MGLRHDSQLDLSLDVQKVKTLLKLLFSAKLYIEAKNIWLSKKDSNADNVEFYSDSRREKLPCDGKKEHHDKKHYDWEDLNVSLS